MDKEQEKEWVEAQKIGVGVNLVEAAKKHLIFLAAVDRNRFLYEDDALQWAIYRYNAFWLPLLAKRLENPVSEDPLVVPLDCEWIWHCHRLNPIRYKLDCEKLYGRILTNHNVISSVQATSKSGTEEIWNKMYPEEPYELDINRKFDEDVLQKGHQNGKFADYDLVSAVKRQISFTFQVSRPYMSDDLFLQEAEARYKGFLHLIRSNRKMGINRFCVPTYDVDLMWHTHQLHPYHYCKDMIKILGTVLQHDDTDSDRSKGSKLDNGFSETTRQWEDTFGKMYWKAGAMSRGSSPTPVTQVPFEFLYEGDKLNPMETCDNPLQLSTRKAVEVFLEFAEIKNLPDVYKDNLVVSFSKKQHDKLFNIKRSLRIFSEAGEKQIAYFQCEPTGEFIFEIKSQSASDKLIPKASTVLGSCSPSLQELLASRQLSVDKWLLVDPVSNLKFVEPVLLHVSVSFTPPTQVPQVLHLTTLNMGKVKPARSQMCITDDDGKVVLDLQMRNIVKDAEKCSTELLKEANHFTDPSEKHQVAQIIGKNWVIKGMHELFTLQKGSKNDGHLFELVGNKMVKLFPGRRLEFEPRHCRNQRCERDFITAVEFSADYPYGRAIALLDLFRGTIKMQDEWIILPAIILGFILSDSFTREGYNGFTKQSGNALDFEIIDGTMKAEVVMDVCNGDKVNAHVSEANGSEESETENGECGVNYYSFCDDNCFSAKMMKSSICGGNCNNCSSACVGKGGGGMAESSLCGGNCNNCSSACVGKGGGEMVKSSLCGGNCNNCSSACVGKGGGGEMLKSSLCGGNCNNCSSACVGKGGGGEMVKSSLCGGNCNNCSSACVGKGGGGEMIKSSLCGGNCNNCSSACVGKDDINLYGDTQNMVVPKVTVSTKFELVSI